MKLPTPRRPTEVAPTALPSGHPDWFCRCLTACSLARLHLAVAASAIDDAYRTRSGMAPAEVR